MGLFDNIQFNFSKKIETPENEFEKDTLDQLDRKIFMAEGTYKERLKQRKQDIIDGMPTI